MAHRLRCKVEKCVTALLLGLPLALGLNNGVARTPPMGWNSWGHFKSGVTAELLAEVADSMVSLGLRDAGYVYVNTDDGWLETNRTDEGLLQPAPHLFPHGGASMKNLSQYIHSRGLKFGIYNSNSLTTCMSKAGGLYKERVDAATYADWGVDYVKYDLCGQSNLQPFVTFQVMRDALNATGRPMLYSCEPQQLRGDPIEWPPYVANMFRIAADMGPFYGDFTGDALLANAWANVAEVGGWTDAGYMEVGNIPGMVNTSLSRTQFALWCIIKTNLLVAADVRKMNSTDPYLQILLNKELIAISQDPLGHVGRLVATQAATATGRGADASPTSAAEASLATGPQAPPKVWPGAAEGIGITECVLRDGAVTSEQRWAIGGATNDSLTHAGNCLTVDSSRDGMSNGTGSGKSGTVSLKPCDGSESQRWLSSRNNASSQPLSEIALTVAPIVKTDSAVRVNGSEVPLCLATNGSSLFLEGCIYDPPECNATRCARRIEISPRWRQLWYLGKSGQVMSTYTGPDAVLATPLPSQGPALRNLPKCLATAANPKPPEPPQPPPVPAGQALTNQLQVWAAKMSGGRRAVVLVNAFDARKRATPGWVWGAANITAHWNDLWLDKDMAMEVRDVIHHRDLGQASAEVTMMVDVYDVAVLVLTPVRGNFSDVYF